MLVIEKERGFGVRPTRDSGVRLAILEFTRLLSKTEGGGILFFSRWIHS